MKFMGIDYGTKRIGVSVSDEEKKLAFPREVVFNDSHLFKRLGKIIDSDNIEEIVVGESVDFSGKQNALSLRIEVFMSELKEKFDLPIHQQKEFLTSVEARRYQLDSRIKVDASAAALILQRYLDKRNNEVPYINSAGY